MGSMRPKLNIKVNYKHVESSLGLCGEFIGFISQ
jgi:hypothetical protein